MSKPDLEKLVDTSSVKVMLSFDYCHFEVVLGLQGASLEEVNELGKDAQRLADERVRQYQKAKERARQSRIADPEREGRRVMAIKENWPQSEWTDEQKAIVKEWEDYQYELNHPYDYDDDWEVE
jgi:hypothetical protein